MFILKGCAVSPGIAIGKAYVYRAFTCDVVESYFDAGAESLYVEKFCDAVAQADMELNEIVNRLTGTDLDKAKIFTAHLDILHDEELQEGILEAIRSPCYPRD